ncbi:MAG: hypothetical protein C4321_01180 [Chloroflexota bacterium]
MPLPDLTLSPIVLPIGSIIPSGSEWLIILVVVLLLFGGKKIPELLRGVGKGVGELQKGLEEGKATFSTAMLHEVEKVEATRVAPVEAARIEPVAVQPLVSEPVRIETAPTMAPRVENDSPSPTA